MGICDSHKHDSDDYLGRFIGSSSSLFDIEIANKVFVFVVRII